MARLKMIGLTALLLASSAHGAFAATAAGLPPMTAEQLLAYAKSLPAGGGGGVVNSNTGPGGATFPGAGGAGAGSAGGGGGAGATPTANTAPPSFEPLPATITGRFRPNEIVAVLQAGSTIDTARAVAQQFGLQLETFTPSRLLRTPVVRFRIPDGRPVPTVLAAMTGDARMLRSQPNFIYGPAAGQAPRKPLLPQYALDVIGAGDAQAAAQGKRPLIAIIDTGIDETHPDLAGSVRDHFDAVGDGKWDSGAHGTSIAGIIAAHGKLLGIAPDATLLSIRAFPAATNEATTESLRRGLDWAAEQHAEVVNMSLAGPEDPVVDATVTAAIAEGIIVVAAAGNEGPGAPPAHPAAVKGVLAVTATDQADSLFARANTGGYISVSAPGVDILSASPGGGYSLESGTSQAAAHVSGLVALLRAIRPDLTPAGALDLMEHSAKDLGAPGMDDNFGAGRIDAGAALKALGNVQAAVK